MPDEPSDTSPEQRRGDGSAPEDTGQNTPGPAGENRPLGAPHVPEGQSDPTEIREDRPDIRAAKAETKIRRWALALLVLIPAVYFVVQKLTS